MKRSSENCRHLCGIVLEREEETEEAKRNVRKKEELFRLMDWASKNIKSINRNASRSLD